MPDPVLSRRGLLAAGAALGLTAAVTPARAVPRPTLAPTRTAAELLTGPFPRAFAFRQAEVLANVRTYTAWRAGFAALGGIVGKLLPEERTDTVTVANRTYFKRFKADFPAKTVLMHYNGRARMPSYRTTGWFAGDWLYRPGTATAARLDATATTVTVADVAPFSLAPDAMGHATQDLVITRRRADGRPDWSVAEHVVLTGIDASTRTLTITRGYLGVPRTFPAGAYVAPHVVAGPWSTQDSRLWLYNICTNAPRPSDGTCVAARIAAEMAADLAPGARLGFLDGIELDVFQLEATIRPTLDADGDGVADGAYVGTVDTYTAGQVDLLARLRVALGDDRLILTDGGAGQRPDPQQANGIEFEGFPRADDPGAALWAPGYAELERFVAAGRAPGFSYPMAKTTPPADPAQRTVAWSTFRLTLAAALLTGAQVTFWDEPTAASSLDVLRTGTPGPIADTFTVWDELLAGTADTPQWLGAPLGPPVRLARSTPDVWGGAGVSVTPGWLAGCGGVGGTVTRATDESGAPILLATPADAGGMRIRLPRLPNCSGDVVLEFDIVTVADDGLPGSLGRPVRLYLITATNQVQLLEVSDQWRSVVGSARVTPGSAVALNLVLSGAHPLRLRGLRLHDAQDVTCRFFEHGAVFANPSSRPFTFDLETLAPGVAYRRLTATAGQDRTVNDGSPVGRTLTVPAADALVIRADG